MYSSLVYKGLGLIDDIETDLVSVLRQTGRESIDEVVGADAATITAEDWPVSAAALPYVLKYIIGALGRPDEARCG